MEITINDQLSAAALIYLLLVNDAVLISKVGKTLIKIHRYSNIVNKEACTKHNQITKCNQVIQKWVKH